MWGNEEIKEYLKNNLKPKRYNHVLGVCSTAIKLAKLYNVDENKAMIAALAHDVAKNLTKEELLNIITEEHITLTEDEKNTEELWHSIVGPVIAKNVFKITDEEILSAIRWHSTGKEEMSKLEKVIYLADVIEPSRNFEGVDEIRKITYENLDLAMIKALTHTTLYLINKGYAVDINTIKARNYLLYNNK